MVIILSIMLTICAIYEEDIGSFFSYDVQENTATYEEASVRRRPNTSFARTEHSDGPNDKGDTVPVPNPTRDPEPTSEAMIEFSSEPSNILTSDPTAEPTTEHTLVSASTQAPETAPTPAPLPSLDVFCRLGIYKDSNGNSIELCLSTEFHTMSYAMRLHYNRGTAGLRGRDGNIDTGDNPYILFTVNYAGEEYPFTIQLGDGYIFVDDSNCFGPLMVMNSLVHTI